MTLRLLVWWFGLGAEAGPRSLPFPNLVFLHSRYSLCYCHTPFLKIYISQNIRTLLLLSYYVMLFQRLLVSVDHWPADSLSPLGHYVRVLGKDGDKDVETQVRDPLIEELIELLAQ